MKPFTFAEWLNEGKSMNTVVDAVAAGVPAGLPVAEHLRQGHRRLQHGAEEPELGTADDLQNAEPQGYTGRCPSLTASTTRSTPSRSLRPPSWTSAASRRWWTPWACTAACPADGSEPNPKIDMHRWATCWVPPADVAADHGQRLRHVRQRRQVLRAHRHHVASRTRPARSCPPSPPTAGTPSSPRWPAASTTPCRKS